MIDWINLTEIAQQDILDPVLGREQELERIIQVLLRRTRNNPLLVGAPGVGKTALVEALAQRIVSGQIPEILRQTRIYTFDLGLALAQARAGGESGNVESLFMNAMAALRQMNEPDDYMPSQQHRLNTILFIDELHLLVTRISDGAAGLGSLIRLALAQGRFTIISETTPEHYQQYQAQALDLDQYFHVIPIAEPSAEQTVAILQGLAPRFAAFHQATIADDAIHAAVDLAIRYLPQRALPDKAVDLLDEAAGHVHGREAAADLAVSSPDRPRIVARKDVEAVVAIWVGLPLAQIGAGEANPMAGQVD
jgi:ATP-dependent Clp protease ATP-binding subunit ClpA